MRRLAFLLIGTMCLWAVVIHAATIIVTCDNDYTLYFNGMYVGYEGGWYIPEVWDVELRAGENVIAVFGHDGSPPDHYCGNGQGLIMELRADDGGVVITDASWRVSVDLPRMIVPLLTSYSS